MNPAPQSSPLSVGPAAASRAGAWLLRGVIRVYQLIFTPMQAFLFGGTGACRFTPSCSAYAREALATHGALTGSWLAARRVCRCHPWGGCGHDPVPPAATGNQIRLAEFN